MTPEVASYTPRLYQPDAYGRYRQYPRNVNAVIPGVGYDVAKLAWAEQELNLDGGGPPTHYGTYRVVPLRGLGQIAAPSPGRQELRAAVQQTPGVLTTSLTSEAQEASGPSPTETSEEDAAAEIERAAAAAEAAAMAPVPGEAPGFFAKKVGPVPLWLLLAGGVAVVGGGAWWALRKR